MKSLVATGGIILFAGALLVRSRPAVEDPRPADLSPAPVETTPAPAAQASEPVEREARKDLLEGAARPRAVPSPRVPAWSLLSPRQEEVLMVIDRDVLLSRDQRNHFADVLLSRQDRIEVYQAEIRRLGIFRVEEYRLRVRQMIAESYDRMAAVLDPKQCLAFNALVDGGRLGDAVEFEMDPDLVVVR